jgi:hypothetical protein
MATGESTSVVSTVKCTKPEVINGNSMKSIACAALMIPHLQRSHSVNVL